MKIAILTQPLHTNYGGLLQAYALQKYLKDRGHEVITVDRQNQPHSFVKWPLVLAKRLYLNVFKGAKLPLSRREERDGLKFAATEVDAFKHTYITTSSPIYSPKGMEVLLQENFDAYVVGSDQVWRPKYSPYITHYFLDFLKDAKVRRIAYAASFGVDEFEYDPETARVCGELLKKFDAVSVREDSAVTLCREKFGVEATHVIDPTLLLSQDDYVALINAHPVSQNRSPERYVMAYVLDRSPWKKQIIDSVCEKLSLPFKEVMPKKYMFKDLRLKDKSAECVFPPVEAWLAGFYHADFVVTDSFHGCVFSILFNKKFIAIGNSSRGLARFKSLLSTFGLDDRLICSGEAGLDKALGEINWCQVNLTIDRLRNKTNGHLSQVDL